MPLQGAEPEGRFGARVQAGAQQGRGIALPAAAADGFFAQAVQGAIRRIPPAQVVVEGGEEPLRRPGDAVLLQPQAFFKGLQDGPPLGLLRGPVLQGAAVVGLQVKDGGGQAAGFQVVKSVSRR